MSVITLNREFWIFVASCAFNPLFWNIIARLEYRNKILTRTIGFGNAYAGCYFLAFVIFTLGLLRDYLFKVALENQPVFLLLDNPVLEWLGLALLAAGNVLVLSSMYRLGITGTYLGDYFGILMTERVTKFPFNVMENPMYNGSTLCFLGMAFLYKTIAGLVLTAWVWFVYQTALQFEGPFTSFIYESASSKKKSIKKKRA